MNLPLYSTVLLFVIVGLSLLALLYISLNWD